MTTLYRWAAMLPLGRVLATFSEATVVVDFPMRRPVIGRWHGADRQLVDVRTLQPQAGRAVGALRHRGVAELVALGTYTVRAWTADLDLRWRAGQALWLSERGDLAVPGAMSAIPVAERTPQRLVRPGRLVGCEPISGWSAWADPEVGVVWYPFDTAGLPEDPAPVLDVIDYTTEVNDAPDGTKEGAVAHLATRWERWRAVPRAVIEAEDEDTAADPGEDAGTE